MPWSSAPPPMPPRTFSTEPPPLSQTPPSEPTLVRAEPVNEAALMAGDVRRAQEVRDEAQGMVRQALEEALAPLHFQLNSLERRLDALERRPAGVPMPAPSSPGLSPMAPLAPSQPQGGPRPAAPPAPVAPRIVPPPQQVQPAPPLFAQPPFASGALSAQPPVQAPPAYAQPLYAPAPPLPAAPPAMAPIVAPWQPPPDALAGIPAPPRLPAIDPSYEIDVPFNGARRKRNVLVFFAIAFVVLLGGLLASMAMSYSR
jgi:hypothetical protein